MGLRSFPSTDARNAKNYSIIIVRAGDSWEKIAKLRKGITVADLRWLNDLTGNVPLNSGQSIKLPHQAFLGAGRDAKNSFLALDYYVQTHRGSLPPDVAHPPSVADQIGNRTTWEHIERNGYVFDRDTILRTRRVTGTITSNASQGRSRTAQSRAGGADRLPGDHGSHYVARRFDGPTEAFNHCAQDGDFNRGGYRALENGWERERKAGKNADIRTTPSYPGLSQRPSSIEVFYTIDGRGFTKIFPNRKGGK